LKSAKRFIKSWTKSQAAGILLPVPFFREQQITNIFNTSQ